MSKKSINILFLFLVALYEKYKTANCEGISNGSEYSIINGISLSSMKELI